MKTNIKKSNSFLAIFSLIIFALSFSPFANAQVSGSNDPTFNPIFFGAGDGGGANNTVYSSVVQADGKSIIAGNFNFYNGILVNGIARINVDGTLDTSFNIGAGPNNLILCTALQTDGKIIIGGYFSTFNGLSANRIARLNTNGSLDTTFIIGTGINGGNLETISLQADGKIIIGGGFGEYNGATAYFIARLHTNGILDTTFNSGTGTIGLILTTALQNDGKIIIGGFFTSYNGTAINNFARINNDGSLDTSFNVGTGANERIETTSIQADGKIIIGGWFSTYNGTTINKIARINTNGTLDTSFNVGTGVNERVYTSIIQADGKIIIGGWFTTYNGTTINRIARLNPNGTLDLTFTTGAGPNYPVYSLAIQTNQKIIIGGDFGAYNNIYTSNFTRLNTNGTLDLAFNLLPGANQSVTTTALQNDGKIIIGGYFTSYNGTPINHIARLNTNGTLDTTFIGTGTDAEIRTTAIQTDGKILIAGQFSFCNGTPMTNIARLNTNGTLDTTFTVGTGTNDEILTIAIQADGKIIIGGVFDNYNGTNINYIARLNTNGTLDTTFNIGAGPNSEITTTTIQADGKIIIGGWFDEYNGIPSGSIARLNTNGALDTNFTIGTGANTVILTTALQADGKIIIGGEFTFYNGTSINKIARLNTNGTIDTTFTTGTGTNGAVFTTAIQAGGEIIIGGDFNSYNGIGSNFIACLNTNGNLDTTFNLGAGADDYVYTTALQADGKIIIGGDFTAYNGVFRNRIARIIGTCIPPSITSITPDSICGTGVAIIAATSSAGTLNWYNVSAGGTLLGTGLTFTSPSISASTTFYVDATLGCTSARTPVITTVQTLPIVTANTTATTVCVGASLTLTGTGATTYTWDNSVTDATPFAPIATTIYNVTGTDANGCTNVDSITVTVNALPNTAVTQAGTVLTASIATGTFQWINCTGNTAINGETNQVYTALANGNYAVIITENGCADTSNCFNVNNVGLNENNGISNINIYPNPPDQFIQIKGLETGIYAFTIYNNLGQVIKGGELLNNTVIDMGIVATGTYYLKIDNRYFKIIKK